MAKYIQQMQGYQQCAVTVMDTTDPDIRFDKDGRCNYVYDFEVFQSKMASDSERASSLEQHVQRIKLEGKGKRYDCVLGMSGGVDSSYLAYLSKQWGLRPLVVHFDNGWNSELAIDNIEILVEHLGFELDTYVINWEEFRDLQRSYFMAGVVDIEVPTDNLIFGALHRLAAKNNVKTILSGFNYATEWLMPPRWNYRKIDATNLKAIHKRFGSLQLKEAPVLGLWNQTYYNLVSRVSTFAPLDLIPYSKAIAKHTLINELGWRDYGGKHYESIFTRFYQGYVLPHKFNIDKRRAHLSNLILTGEIDREQALRELELPTYDHILQLEDLDYVRKKLGFSEGDFNALMHAEPIPHQSYGTDAVQREYLHKAISGLQSLRRHLNTVLR